MKKLLLTTLLMMVAAFQSFADGTGNTSSQNIRIDINSKGLRGTTIRRTPSQIDLNVYYDAETQTIEISYSGDADGEVYLYHNETLVDYDTEINTTFSLPSPTGVYRIEVTTDSWTADGYLEL
ncbi:MAG: hypothetical protein K2K68_03915 [Duncaniella sp.]|nr:hypothetical protein [Duncaniella sp.]